MVVADRFKQINTEFAHLTGDFVLSEIAAVLKASIRGSDAIARYGGDECLSLLANTTASGAQKVIERIKTNVDEWNTGDHIEGHKINISIGAAEWREGQTLDEVLDGADERMYENKSSR